MNETLTTGFPKIITTKGLARMLNCSVSTVLIYIGRPEFSHIKRGKIKQARVYKEMTKFDFDLLSKYIETRKKKTGKK